MRCLLSSVATVMLARLTVAALIGLGCVGATVAVGFWALWALDGGWDLPPTLAYGGLLTASFVGSGLVSRSIPAPRPEWSPLAVGVGSTLGMALMIVSIQMVPESERLGLAHALAFALSSIGAFAGTFYRPGKASRPASSSGQPGFHA